MCQQFYRRVFTLWYFYLFIHYHVLVEWVILAQGAVRHPYIIIPQRRLCGVGTVTFNEGCVSTVSCAGKCYINNSTSKQ